MRSGSWGLLLWSILGRSTQVGTLALQREYSERGDGDSEYKIKEVQK